MPEGLITKREAYTFSLSASIGEDGGMSWRMFGERCGETAALEGGGPGLVDIDIGTPGLANFSGRVNPCRMSSCGGRGGRDLVPPIGANPVWPEARPVWNRASAAGGVKESVGC